jgi:hypothetical protein
MTDDLELEEQRMLGAARREFSPDAEAMERVRVATGVALLVPPGAPAAGSEASPLEVLWHAPGLATRLAAAALLSVSAGLIGYGLGTQQPAMSGESSRPRIVAPVIVSAARPAGPAVPAPVPDDVVTTAPSATGAPPSRSTRARAEATHAHEPVPAADALQLELSTVKRVESELRVGNPARALMLLLELDQRVPGGQLREERSAAQAIARCALGSSDARELGEAFVAQFPGSVYEARVRQRCDEAAR